MKWAAARLIFSLTRYNQCDQIWRNFASLANFLTVYFLLGTMLSLLWRISHIIGLIFTVANGQILKNNLTIWSHWNFQQWALVGRFYLTRFETIGRKETKCLNIHCKKHSRQIIVGVGVVVVSNSIQIWNTERLPLCHSSLDYLLALNQKYKSIGLLTPIECYDLNEDLHFP